MKQRSERTTGKIDPFAAQLPEGPPPSSVLILDIWPQVDGGRFGIKRVLGDAIQLWADIFKDGHDKIAAQIDYWPSGTDDVRTAEICEWQGGRREQCATARGDTVRGMQEFSVHRDSWRTVAVPGGAAPVKHTSGLRARARCAGATSTTSLARRILRSLSD